MKIFLLFLSSSLFLGTLTSTSYLEQVSGTVYVLVNIDETGKVISAIDMCQGPPYLSESSIKAVWKSRFSPTKLSGKPVKVRGLIQYNFVKR